MNSVLKTHSSRLSYSCSCRIMKSSCIVLKNTNTALAIGVNLKCQLQLCHETHPKHLIFVFDVSDIHPCSALMEAKMETRNHLPYLHGTKEGSHIWRREDTSQGYSVPTREAQFFPWWAFYNSFSYCTTWSVLSHWLKSHMLTLTVPRFLPLKQFIEHPIDNKGPKWLSLPCTLSLSLK